MREFLITFAIVMLFCALVGLGLTLLTSEKQQPAFSTPCIHNLAFIYDRGYLTQVIDENGKGVRCV